MRYPDGRGSLVRAPAKGALVALLLYAGIWVLPASSGPALADSSAAEAAALMQAGVDAIERGVYDRAAVDFSNALDSGGLTAEGRAIAYHHRGVAFQKLGQQEAAVDDYTSAIESRALPAKILPKTHYNRGIALANTGREAEAERDYMEAIRLNPDYAAAYHNLANLERRRGDYEAAILHYTSAIANMAGRDRKLPLFGRALSYEQQGKLQSAAGDLKQALAVDPEFELAETKLSALAPMLTKAEEAEPEVVASPEATSATLAPFQTAASDREGGQIIRVASIGGWRTTATRFSAADTARPAVSADATPPSDELVTGSLRPAEGAPETKPMQLAGTAPAETGISRARYRVQLGAFREEAVARRAWGELSAAAKPLLGGSDPAIRRADLGAKGVFYRLQAGTFAQIADAKSACEALERRKIACFVVESDA